MSSREGAIDCRVIAVAGPYALLAAEKPEDALVAAGWSGMASLTFLEGMLPVGIDGAVETGRRPGEIRFRHVSGPSQSERRNAVRVPVSLPVQVTLPGGEVVQGQTIDLSAGGLRLRHLGRLAVDQPVKVSAEFPGGVTLQADAIVRAAHPGACSLQFTALQGITAEALGEWTVDVMRAHLQRAA